MFGSLLARVRVPAERDDRLSSRPPQSPQEGHKTVALDTYRDWQIEVARSRFGLVVRRDQFTAHIQPTRAGSEECLSGFATPQAALAAARKRIDLLSISPMIRWHQPHSPLRTRRT